MWRGIRVRITALATVVVIAVLVLTALALLSSQRRLLTNNLDDSLLAHSAQLAASVRADAVGETLARQGDDDSIAQIVTNDGEVIAATRNFADERALPPPPGDAKRRIRSTRLFTGEPDYRLVSRRVGDVVIHTGTPLDDIDDSVTALRRGLFVAIPIVALALAALIWCLVGRTLRPVETIRREVADISGRDLHRRVPEVATGDEIARLARTMNAMLNRIEGAAERQQRFVADASHELRSPLTRIRSELEVDLGHPETADLAATQRSVLAETQHLQRLVDDLLFLARSDDRGDRARPAVAVDLDDIVLRETQQLRGTTVIDIDTAGVSAAQVVANPDDLARVVRNLLDNATRHARSKVTVTLTEDVDHATLAVADDGPGIPAEHHELVFARFGRLDEARTHTGGTGLGLAITREIIERYGGTILIDTHNDLGARFVIERPLARQS